jgi:hypothetical protein
VQLQKAFSDHRVLERYLSLKCKHAKLPPLITAMAVYCFYIRLFATSSGRWVSIAVTEVETMFGLSPSRSSWLAMDAAKLVKWLV